MALDLRQLRYFVAVAEAGQITRAAELLGMGQPPLSQQIQAMEARLGLQLFRRRPRGVELTEAGRVLMEEAQAILARLAQAELAVRATARGEQGRLRIGVAPTAPFHPLVPGVIRAFREAWPGMVVTLDECLSRQALEGLAAATLDAAFIRAELPAGAGLTIHRLLDEPMVMALPASHPLVGETPRPLSDFAGDSFIAFARQDGPGMFTATLMACERAGFSPILGQEAPRITSTLGLVAAGLGVALVPASLLSVRMDGVAFSPLRLADRPLVPLQLVLGGGPHSPALRRFAGMVRRMAREAAQAAKTA